LLTIARCAGAAAAANLAEVARRNFEPALRAGAAAALAVMPSVDPAILLGCVHDHDPLVRAAAAIALARALGPAAPGDVGPALVEAVRTWQALAPRWAALPHAELHLLAALALAVGLSRSREAFALAPTLALTLDVVDGASATAHGEGLLALALGRGRPPFAPRFVELLDAVVRATTFWQAADAARAVLAAWNLPGDRDGLRALAAALHASPTPEADLVARMFPDGLPPEVAPVAEVAPRPTAVERPAPPPAQVPDGPRPPVARELAPLLVDHERPEDHWRVTARRLDDRGDPGGAIVAAARAAGRGGAARHLRELVGRHARGDAEGRARAQRALTEVERQQRRDAALPTLAATVITAILDGGDPSLLLRELARAADHRNHAHIALDLIRDALAIAPADRT
jgi:hypothetical protein